MEKQVAQALLDVKAVALSPNAPFTWASGIKSPIYCDNRYILSFPVEREVVVNAFVELIKTNYPEVEMLMGTATAGIPWAALVAEKLNLPMGYVRGSSKDHGRQNQIEGRVVEGAKILVIEDLISTGGSVKTVIDSLRDAKQDVLAVVAIFTYLLPKATKCFEDLNLEFKTLSNYDVLIDVAVSKNYIEESDLNKLKEWKKDPSDSSWMDK